MALGDITILEQASTNGRGARVYNVAASPVVINAGEPVVRLIGGTTVFPGPTNLIAVASPWLQQGGDGTNQLVGVAQTTSTNTSSAAGTVEVLPANVGTTYLINANSTTLVNTQAKYNALVGKRVLIDLTGSTYTMLLTDSALNGCVVMPLDIAKYPGKVAFTFRNQVTDLV